MELARPFQRLGRSGCFLASLTEYGQYFALSRRQAWLEFYQVWEASRGTVWPRQTVCEEVSRLSRLTARFQSTLSDHCAGNRANDPPNFSLLPGLSRGADRLLDLLYRDDARTNLRSAASKGLFNVPHEDLYYQYLRKRILYQGSSWKAWTVRGSILLKTSN